MDAGSWEAWHGERRGVVCKKVGGGRGKGQGVWREKSGTQKQQEGEVATAPSPSYKCGAGVTAFAITPARF